jgi:excisionase family DNA binding protein
VKAVVGRLLVKVEDSVMRSDHKPSSETSTELYDIPELARMLRVSEDFVRSQVQQRRIPYYKVGKLVRFDPREVTDWLAGLRIDALR